MDITRKISEVEKIYGDRPAKRRVFHIGGDYRGTFEIPEGTYMIIENDYQDGLTRGAAQTIRCIGKNEERGNFSHCS